MVKIRTLLRYLATSAGDSAREPMERAILVVLGFSEDDTKRLASRKTEKQSAALSTFFGGA